MPNILSHFRGWVLGGAVLVLAQASVVYAQQNTPRVGYVYPAGGQQGSTLELVVGGQRLDGVVEAHFSSPGVRAKVLEFIKPLTQAQFSLLRDQFKELVDKKVAALRQGPPAESQPATRPAWTAEDEKKLAEIRKKLQNPPRRQLNPAIAETVTLQVTIDPAAEVGRHEMRLITSLGVTNPIMFVVGQLPEVTAPRAGATPTGAPSATRNATDFALPATLNGQIMPGAVERYRFKARQGQQLVIAVSARALIPYISDAVPGWFQAAVTLTDAKGNELAFADHDRHQPDPVMHYVVPSDGEYVLEIRDSIYRGREDFVYRIAVGELPWITSIFPRGGQAGTVTKVQLAGWNLPASTMIFDAKQQTPGVYSLSLTKAGVASNSVPFAIDDLPETPEREPNHRPNTAQPLTLPIIVNGRVDALGVADVFRFEGKAGDEIVTEVMARRLDSPLDSVLTLTTAAGNQIACNDDHEDKGSGLNTHHADSYLRVVLPATDTYYLSLADIQGKGGPAYGYRLRISLSRPDFELRVVPASISIRGGSSVPLTVYALRRDGFAGEINLALRGSANGFTLGGAKISAGQDQLKLTLKAPPMHLDDPVPLVLEGRATIQGQSVVHAAVPAEDMMQAFLYRHLVPAQELLAAVNAAPIARANMKIVSATPVKITPGQNTQIEVAMPATTLLGKVELELTDPPEGISLQSVSSNQGSTLVVLACDAAKMRPGGKGNLILNAFVERQPPVTVQNPQPVKRRVPMGALPAIPYEILGKPQ
ncbi:MAG: PPC domain-containing protein [Phycisphaerae bacterium]